MRRKWCACRERKSVHPVEAVTYRQVFKETAVAKARRRRRWSPEKFRQVWEERKRSGPADAVAVASACGLRSATTIYAWLRGEGRPDYDQFQALIEALDTTEESLSDLM